MVALLKPCSCCWMLFGLQLAMPAAASEENYALGGPAPICWRKDKIPNEVMVCPPDLQVDWLRGSAPPGQMFVGIEEKVRVTLNFSLDVLRYLASNNLLSSTNMTAAEKMKRCNTTAACTSSNTDQCCIAHANAHNCPYRPGTLCTPLLDQTGFLATSSAAQKGNAENGKSMWEFPILLTWPGVYTVIIHFQIGLMSFAIGISTTAEYVSSVCSDKTLVPSNTATDVTGVLCVACPAGSQSQALGIPANAIQLTADQAWSLSMSVFCILCPLGTASPDGRGCVPCATGTFAASNNSMSCSPCPAGTFAAIEGTSICVPCFAGMWAAAGSSYCNSCPLNSYRALASPMPLGTVADCLSCSSSYATLQVGSRLPSDCVCPAGTWEPVALQGCVACGVGLACAGGAATPGQVKGYYVQPFGSDYVAYRCLQDRCPAGLASSCPPGRTGLACDVCMPGYYPVTQGSCQACLGSDRTAFIVLLLILLAGCLLLLVLATSDPAKHRMSMNAVMCHATQSVVTLQLLSSFSSLSPDWVAPLHTTFSTLSVLSFDVDVIKLSCVLGSDSPLLKYITTVLSLPAALVLLLFIYSLRALLSYATRGQSIRGSDVMNSCGSLITLFFMPIALVCVKPFRCVEGPNHGVSTVAAMPSLVCGSPTQKSMVVIGAFGCVMYLGLVLGACAAVTAIYPKVIGDPGGSKFMRATRFMFQRFSPACYYYGLIYKMRSVALAFLPVIFPESGCQQAYCIFIVLLLSHTSQSMLLPWRTRISNTVDNLCSLLLLVVITAALANMNYDRSAQNTDISTSMYTGGVIFLALWAVAVTSSLYTVWRSWRLKQYGIYISHHKGSSASIARLLKMMMEAKSKKDVFLDSDSPFLCLDAMLDTVRSETIAVCALVTRASLRSSSCAAELVMAHLNAVPILMVTDSDSDAFSDNDLARVSDKWSQWDIAPLTAAGISWEAINQTYLKLGTLPRFVVPLHIQSCEEVKAIDAAMDCLVQAAKIRHVATRQRRSLSLLSSVSNMSDADAEMFIIANVDDSAAIASAVVLSRLMFELTSSQPTVVFEETDLQFSSLRLRKKVAIFVCLTRNCLESPLFAKHLLAARQAAEVGVCATVPILADQGFAFPSVERLSNAIVPPVAARCGVAAPLLEKCYTKVLNTSALPFSSNMSKKILIAETRALVSELGRVLREQLKSSSEMLPSLWRHAETSEQFEMKTVRKSSVL